MPNKSLIARFTPLRSPRAQSSLSRMLHRGHHGCQRITGVFFPFAIRRGHAASTNIEPILHLVFIPLVLLSKRNFQLLPFLIPFGHERAAPILSYQLAFTNPFRLALELIVLAESTNVGLHTIRQADPAKLTQSNNTIGSKMMQLYLERFQDLAKEARC